MYYCNSSAWWRITSKIIRRLVLNIIHSQFGVPHLKKNKLTYFLAHIFPFPFFLSAPLIYKIFCLFFLPSIICSSTLAPPSFDFWSLFRYDLLITQTQTVLHYQSLFGIQRSILWLGSVVEEMYHLGGKCPNEPMGAEYHQMPREYYRNIYLQ